LAFREHAGRRITVKIRVVAVSLALITLLYGATASLAAGGRSFSTDLSGAEEISAATGLPNAGDPDATGTATVTFNRGLGEVCFDISVEGIDLPVLASHIHNAPAGSNGPIVVGFLMEPVASGQFSGCVSTDRELIKDITKNPTNYYVNVHTGDFTAGAVRGQLGD
jgi:hypothetical protein